MRLKHIIFIFIGTMLLSGCSVTYDLDISYNQISESLNIFSTNISESDYFVPAYYNSINEKEYDVDINRKLDSIIYYNKDIEPNKLSFEYTFDKNEFFRSSAANTFYSGFIFKQYDHDEDGKKDYYLLSTTNDFSGFNKYKELKEVTIRIKNNHEVISVNADEIDGNMYIWHFTPNNTSSINMVYNPNKVVDYRTTWQKIKEGEYTNVFTISLALFLIGIIGYFIIKRKGDIRNEI